MRPSPPADEFSALDGFLVYQVGDENLLIQWLLLFDPRVAPINNVERFSVFLELLFVRRRCSPMRGRYLDKKTIHNY